MADSELPEGWTTATIGDTAEYINGRGFKKSEWEGEGRPIIRIQNLTGTADDFNYTTLDVDEKYVVPPGTILVSWSATLDAFRWHGPEGVLNQHIFKVVPNKELVEEDFLFWLLKREIQEMVRSAKLQGSTMKHIRRDPFLDHEFPLPPKPEQSRIADRLDAIHSRARQTDETLAKVPDRIEEYRQSVLNAAFSGRLTADWREDHTDVEPAEAMLKRILDKRRERWEKDYRAKYEAKGKEPPSGWKSRYSEPDGLESPSDLANLPETWTWARVERLCWASRYGTSEKCDYDQEGPPVLRIPNIRGRKVTLGDMKFAASDADLSNIDPLRPGDFLVIRTNGSGDIIGRAGLIEEKFEEPHFFASYLIRFRLLSVSSLPEWFNLIWDSPIVRREIVQEAASSAGQYNISQSAIFDFALPLPPAAEMKELVRRTNQRLDKIDEMAQHVEQADERLNHLDRSVLAKAFRGELVETEAERARREDRDYETAEELLNRVKEKTTRDTDTTSPKSDGEKTARMDENGQIKMKVVGDENASL